MAVVGVGALRPEGGHFKGLPLPHHCNSAVGDTGRYGVGEPGQHLLRAGRGGDVPILGDSAQKAVPDTAAHRIGGKSGCFQRLQKARYPYWQKHVSSPLLPFLLYTSPGLLKSPGASSLFLQKFWVVIPLPAFYLKYLSAGQPTYPLCQYRFHLQKSWYSTNHAAAALQWGCHKVRKRHRCC